MLEFHVGSWAFSRPSGGRQELAGTDEAGRGAWAGPVVAASVSWAPTYDPPWLRSLKDSKLLSFKTREQLALEIIADPRISFAIAWATVEEIDSENILRASLKAMMRAIECLPPPLHLYIDGNQPLPVTLPQTPVVDGDARIPQVSAASILAKVFRDRWMQSLHELYPAYGWEHNFGYGTPEHREALLRWGPTPLHRRSFRPVAFPSLF